MKLEFKINGGDFSKAGHASSEVKKLLKKINVDSKIIRRIVVSLYEAEVNICAHAYKGKISVEIDNKQIIITVEDIGPGIKNIEQAMQEGFSTATEQVREMGFGAGMGLPNIKRNSDHLDIQSVLNKGTVVTITNKLQ